MKGDGFIFSRPAQFIFRGSLHWSGQLKIPYSETKIMWVGTSAVEYSWR